MKLPLSRNGVEYPTSPFHPEAQSKPAREQRGQGLFVGWRTRRCAVASGAGASLAKAHAAVPRCSKQGRPEGGSQREPGHQGSMR